MLLCVCTYELFDWAQGIAIGVHGEIGGFTAHECMGS